MLLYHVDEATQRTFAAPFLVAHPQLALPPKQLPSPTQPCPVKPFLPWAAHPHSRPCRLGSSRPGTLPLKPPERCAKEQRSGHFFLSMYRVQTFLFLYSFSTSREFHLLRAPSGDGETGRTGAHCLCACVCVNHNGFELVDVTLCCSLRSS